jgi:hypothetical protein
VAKEIKPEPESGAARFLKGVESMRPVEHRGAVGAVNTSLLAELRGPAAADLECVPRPHEKVKREFVITRETDEQLNELVRILRQTTTAKLSGSHVLRAFLRLLASRVSHVQAAASSYGPRRLPSTGRAQTMARVDFDLFLGSIFELAISGKPPHHVSVPAELVTSDDKIPRS